MTTTRCPECEGSGYYVDVQPACCGNLSRGGECRGDCAIPEERQVACPGCAGSGEVVIIDEQLEKEKTP